MKNFAKLIAAAALATVALPPQAQTESTKRIDRQSRKIHREKHDKQTAK